MKNCKYCNKEFNYTNNRQIYCSRNCKNYFSHKKSGYKYSRDYRSRSVRNYLAQLRSYYNRKETLSLDFLEDLYKKQNGKCAISGIILTFTQNQGRCPTNVSLDRIDSSKGYEPENVQLVCHKVNIMKGESSGIELLEWCQTIINKADPKS